VKRRACSHFGRGARGRAYVETHHDWDLLAERFAGVLSEVVAKPRSEER